jgi:hypothetical protein
MYTSEIMKTEENIRMWKIEQKSLLLESIETLSSEGCRLPCFIYHLIILLDGVVEWDNFRKPINLNSKIRS